MKDNPHTKYFPFTYNDIALNEKQPIMKENLCIFFFIIGGVECNMVPCSFPEFSSPAYRVWLSHFDENMSDPHI